MYGGKVWCMKVDSRYGASSSLWLNKLHFLEYKTFLDLRMAALSISHLELLRTNSLRTIFLFEYNSKGKVKFPIRTTIAEMSFLKLFWIRFKDT